MIREEISSSNPAYRKGTLCTVCTGCGRCPGVKVAERTDVIGSFRNSGDEQVPPVQVGEGLFSCGEMYGGSADVERQTGIESIQSDITSIQSDTSSTQSNTAGIQSDVETITCFPVACADIGTTTVAMVLRDAGSGRVIQQFRIMNPQRKWGSDVISRIEAADRDSQSAAEMRQAILATLKEGLDVFRIALKQKYGNDSSVMKIHGLTISANTTMVHLLMGWDTKGLGEAPFRPVSVAEQQIGIDGIPAVILPGVSAFIGGDILAGVKALQMDEREDVTLLLDLGTNGEMVLGNCHRLLAAGTSAGPAFEGNTENMGSDLMKQTAALLESGCLDETGLLADPYFENGVDAGGVHLTQSYIRQLQMAKAAIASGIAILSKKYGLTGYDQISQVYLAGGMGFYLDVKAAAKIGLFPAELAERTVAVGNSSLEGAYRRALFKEWTYPAIEAVNLAEEPDFGEIYLNQMNLEPMR